jgi:hypothetical protein
MPRVTNAFPVTSSGQPLATPQEGETNATVVIKKDGAVCLEGDLVAGWVQLELGMMTVDSATGTIVDALDAEGLGVTALQFDVESPPQSGLSVQLISATLDCSPVSECQQWGFFLKGEGARDTQALFTESQTVTAPISAFYKTDSADRSWELDASALAGVALMHEGERGKFDYCVRNFKLLDSRGRVVAP